VYGQHDAGWLSFYEYFAEVCGFAEKTASLDGLLLAAKSAGWWLPHKHVCWVSERHCVVEQDDLGRLHCEGGPAVEYPDGWSVYAYHGARVPEWVITRPQDITIDKIDAEANSEIRRAMMQIIGAERLVLESNMTVVDEDTNSMGLPRRLLRRDRQDEPPQQFIHLINCAKEPDGSRKPYIFKVPPGVSSIRQAMNWHMGLPLDQTTDYSTEA
jgi:hypothetical protein